MVLGIIPNVLPEMTCFLIGERDCLIYGDEAKVHDLLYGLQVTDWRVSVDKVCSPRLQIVQENKATIGNHPRPPSTSYVRVDLC